MSYIIEIWALRGRWAWIQFCEDTVKGCADTTGRGQREPGGSKDHELGFRLFGRKKESERSVRVGGV